MITDSINRADTRSINEIREQNNNWLDAVQRGGEMQKEASDAQTMTTRLRLRERSYLHKFIPPEVVTNDMLARVVDTIQPYVVVDLECDVPGSATIPFNHNGNMIVNMQNSRYAVYINRLVSPTMYKDVGELRTSTLDIRQVVMDAIVKDLSAFIDTRFMAVNNQLLQGPDVYIPYANNKMFRKIPGSITRSAIIDTINIIAENGENFGLECSNLLINNVTVKELMKWGREETGGDMAQDILQNGLSTVTLLGKTWVVTIKRDLVPNGRIYGYTSPDFLGKNYVLSDTTVTVRQDKYFLQFDCMMEQGCTIGNILGLSAVQFGNA